MQCLFQPRSRFFTIVYLGYTGIMENKMETTIVYWGYIGIMENFSEASARAAARCLPKLSRFFTELTASSLLLSPNPYAPRSLSYPSSNLPAHGLLPDTSPTRRAKTCREFHAVVILCMVLLQKHQKQKCFSTQEPRNPATFPRTLGTLQLRVLLSKVPCVYLYSRESQTKLNIKLVMLQGLRLRYQWCPLNIPGSVALIPKP